MNRWLRSAVAAFLATISLAAPAWAQLPAYPGPVPAFPGADGAARNVTGGRGGIVYRVTKVDRGYGEDGAGELGTLRYGLNDSNFPAFTPRTIVFDVAGTFWLGKLGPEDGHHDGWTGSESRINIPNYVTVAGQTAPGPVIIAGGQVKIGNGWSDISNSILRNVTIAAGYGMSSFEQPEAADPNVRFGTPGDFPDSTVFDAIDISGVGVMVDHVSTVYATDETISANEEAADVTIQYSSIAQGQNYPQADAEGGGSFTGHALGSLLQAGSNAKISILNNLYAHLKGRLPRVGTEANKLTTPGVGAINDFRNNVFYNWLGTAGQGASGQPSSNNFISNFYLAGPGGDDVAGPNIVNASGGTGIFSGGSSTVTKVYANGNLRDTNKDGDANDTSSADGAYSSSAIQATAYDVNIGATLNAADAFHNVLRYMGPNWWTRDYDYTQGNTGAIDTINERLIHETYTGTGKIVAWADNPFNDYEKPFTEPDEPPAHYESGYQNYDPAEGAEWRQLLSWRADPVTGDAPFNRGANWDNDSDGMPNYWELAHGMDPDVANNNADADLDTYTDVEEYLNDLAAWPAPGPMVFNGANSQYARITNWEVKGRDVSIAGSTVTTSSLWQPSRYDTAVIHNGQVIANRVGQHANSLLVSPDTGDNGDLRITAGWLRVEDTLALGAGGATAFFRLSGTGQLHVDTITMGPAGTFSFIGGLLNADEVGFSLTCNGGTISPGNNTFDLQNAIIDFGGVDAMHVAGDLRMQGTASKMLIDIAGNQPGEYDFIDVDGKLTASGTLQVTLDGYSPISGDVFNIFDAATWAGSFTTVLLPTLNGSLSWNTSNLLTTGELSVIGGVSADFDGDEDVDGVDFLIWQAGYGLTGQTNNSNGDANFDGVVNGDDLLAWENAYGLPMLITAVSAAAVAVPEPATGLMMLGSLAGLMWRRK